MQVVSPKDRGEFSAIRQFWDFRTIGKGTLYTNQPTRSRYSHRRPEMAAPLSQSVQRPGTSQLLLWVQCRSVRLAVGFWWEFGFDHLTTSHSSVPLSGVGVGRLTPSISQLALIERHARAGLKVQVCVFFCVFSMEGKMQDGLMRSRCAPLVRTSVSPRFQL
jgi:hypothetical protein